MKTIVIFISFFILNISCNSYNNSYNYYYRCMNKYKQETGLDFYGSLEQFQKDLKKNGLIKEKSKISYVKALEQINQKDANWENFYKKNSNKTYFSDIRLGYVQFELVCSNIDIRKKGLDGVKPNLSNIQKYSFYKLSNNPVNDWDILDYIFLSTDIHNKIGDLNLIYLIFLNLDITFKNKTHINK